MRTRVTGTDSLTCTRNYATLQGSSFVGPLVLGAVAQATGSMRPGLFYSFILIIIPAVLLLRFDVRKGYEQARAGKSVHASVKAEAV